MNRLNDSQLTMIGLHLPQGTRSRQFRRQFSTSPGLLESPRPALHCGVAGFCAPHYSYIG